MSDDNNIVKPDRGPVIGGVVFIVAGTVLLLEKLGYLPHGFALKFWPMIFIVVGLVKIAYAGGRVMGAVFIVIGVLLQLQQTGILRVEFWQLWPVAIIIAGVAMLWQALVREAPSATTGGPQFDAFYIFGGGERRVSAKDFKGARLMSVFGGYKVDLRYADIDGTQAVIEANAIFGGGEIIVPEHWAIVMQGVGIFGAYEDKSRHFQPDTTKPTKTLVVKGVAVFGGIEIKN